MQTVQATRERVTHLLSADEIGRRLGIDVSTVYRMAGDGRLHAIKVGRQWRFPEDSVPVAGVGARIDPATADAVAAVAADILGVMVLVADLDGELITHVHNPCQRYEQASSGQPGICSEEWRALADRHDLVPRFRRGELGYECAAAFVRSGDRLVGLVMAAGIAPVEEPAPDLHVLTRAQRSLVLDSLPRIAAAVVERRTS